MHPCRVKDWIVFMRRTSSSDKRDVVRDRISDELTSLLVWCGVVVVCVDALSLRLGIAVGTAPYRYAAVALHWIRWVCHCLTSNRLYTLLRDPIHTR